MPVQLVKGMTADGVREMIAWSRNNPGAPSPLTGKLFDMADVEYFAVDAVSQSLLKHYEVSPAHARASRETHKDTPALVFGRAVHCAVLQNELFASQYGCREEKPKEPERPAHLKDVTRQSKAGKELIAGWEAEWRPDYDRTLAEWQHRMTGKTFLREQEMEAIYQISAKVVGDPFYGQFVEKGLAEVAVFARCPRTGIWCKGKLDKYLPESELIVDLKTTKDTAAQFEREVFKRDYDMQAAFYMDLVLWSLGVAPRAYLIMSIEKYPPYEPRVMMLSSRATDLGRARYERLIDVHAGCLKTNQWPGYERRITTLEPPDWKMAKEGIFDEEDQQVDEEEV